MATLIRSAQRSPSLPAGRGEQHEADGRGAEADDVERQRVHQRAGEALGDRDPPRREHRHPQRDVARRRRDGRHQDRDLVVLGRAVRRDARDVERQRERVEHLAHQQHREQDRHVPPRQVGERAAHLAPVDPPDQADHDDGDRPGPPPRRPSRTSQRLQKSTGSRMIGQVMQWPPPRPRPSSAPTIVITSTPGLAQQRVGERVAVVGEDHARLERDGVVAAVPLLPLGLVDVAAGVDHLDRRQPELAGHDVDELRRRPRRAPRRRAPCRTAAA